MDLPPVTAQDVYKSFQDRPAASYVLLTKNESRKDRIQRAMDKASLESVIDTTHLGVKHYSDSEKAVIKFFQKEYLAADISDIPILYDKMNNAIQENENLSPIYTLMNNIVSYVITDKKMYAKHLKLIKSNEGIFKELVKKNPNDPLFLFEAGIAADMVKVEANGDAVDMYKRAIKILERYDGNINYERDGLGKKGNLKDSIFAVLCRGPSRRPFNSPAAYGVRIRGPPFQDALNNLLRYKSDFPREKGIDKEIRWIKKQLLK